MNKKNKKLRTPKKKSNLNKILLIVLISLLTIILAVLVTYAIMASIKPVVEDDAGYHSYKTDESGNIIYETDADGNTKYDKNGNPVPVIDYDNPVNRLEDSYNFLVVGKDNIALNTDVMMIINLDLKDSKISIMQLPRDTLINYMGARRKLNSVFALHYNALPNGSTADRTKAGMEGLEAFLEDSFKIKIDYYAHLNLDAFGKVVDTIGGVDMYVPYRMYYQDPGQNLYIDLYEGQQTLNGDQAEQFVRFRNSYINGDLDRIDAQKLFMTAFFQSFKDNISLSNVTPIVTTILGNLTHNFNLQETVYFVNQALKMDFSNILMFTAPHTNYDNYGSYVVVHKPTLLNLVNEHFNVFDTPIHSIDFDIEHNFTEDGNYDVEYIYNSDAPNYEEFTAEEVQQGEAEVRPAW